MKNIAKIASCLLLALFLLTACADVQPSDNGQATEPPEDSQTINTPDASQPPTMPDFFADMGKTLSALQNEHPNAVYDDQLSAFPDAGAACLVEPDMGYAYFFFGGQSGDFTKAFDAFADQLKCAGFVTTAGTLFPQMAADMAFADFFALISISDYHYFTKEEQTVALGWLNFTYNDMDVWLNTNEITPGGGSDFTDEQIVKITAPVSIVDLEISRQNQALADTVVFE